MENGPWNWLEIAKLSASVMTPVVLAAFGIYVHRITKRFEHVQWRSQKLIEKRLSIYDDLSPLFNDVLCYFTYIGCWRDLNPPDVVNLKRSIDKKIHLAAPLFGQKFFDACMAFQALCFETYTGWGRDALLRTAFIRRSECRPDDWNSEWEACFAKSAADPNSVRDAYRKVMEAFSEDIGVHALSVIPPSGRPPLNVR